MPSHRPGARKAPGRPPRAHRRAPRATAMAPAGATPRADVHPGAALFRALNRPKKQCGRQRSFVRHRQRSAACDRPVRARSACAAHALAALVPHGTPPSGIPAMPPAQIAIAKESPQNALDVVGDVVRRCMDWHAFACDSNAAPHGLAPGESGDQVSGEPPPVKSTSSECHDNRLPRGMLTEQYLLETSLAMGSSPLEVGFNTDAELDHMDDDVISITSGDAVEIVREANMHVAQWELSLICDSLFSTLSPKTALDSLNPCCQVLGPQLPATSISAKDLVGAPISQNLGFAPSQVSTRDFTPSYVLSTSTSGMATTEEPPSVSPLQAPRPVIREIRGSSELIIPANEGAEKASSLDPRLAAGTATNACRAMRMESVRNGVSPMRSPRDEPSDRPRPCAAPFVVPASLESHAAPYNPTKAEFRSMATPKSTQVVTRVSTSPTRNPMTVGAPSTTHTTTCDPKVLARPPATRKRTQPETLESRAPVRPVPAAPFMLSAPHRPSTPRDAAMPRRLTPRRPLVHASSVSLS